MAQFRRMTGTLVMVMLAVITLGGCTTSKKYHMTAGDMPAAVPLNYAAGDSALELRLITVIANQGPGSWKQSALWDEYVVSLTNRGPGPLSAEGAVLVDILGENKLPGTDPWILEKLSETNWERYARVGRFVIGIGAAAGAMEVAAIGYGLAAGGAAGIFFLMPAVLIANVTTVAVMDHQNKDKVQNEFERRRLRLPLELAGGATVQGSLFFPMAPAPRRLLVQVRAGDAPFEVGLDLTPLAGLHLEPAVQ